MPPATALFCNRYISDAARPHHPFPRPPVAVVGGDGVAGAAGQPGGDAGDAGAGAAGRAGYDPNPLLGAALSAVRRGRQQQYRGTLALVDAAEAEPEHYLTFHREIAAGAKVRAEELGFATELFWLGEGPGVLSHRRLSGMLRARGIPGAVLLPFHTARDFSDFDFTRLAAVQMDHSLVRPQLHTILPDHYVSIVRVVERMALRGYRRIGLCLEERKELRVRWKWSAGFLTHWRSRGVPGLVPLISAGLTKETFLPWFREQRPDLIIGHVQALTAWLAEEGVRVPEDVGFVNLNLTEKSGPCAGLDLQPRRLGAVAVETVVGMLHRRERGVPEQPQTITLEATWCEGPTLR